MSVRKKVNAKECLNYHTVELISDASEVILKILQARLQQYVSWELTHIQDGFRKSRGTTDQISNIRYIIEEAGEFQKYPALLTMLKPLTVWITTNCGKRWEYQTTLPVSWESCIQDRKQQLELVMEKWTSSKLRKEYVKAVNCHPVYFAYLTCVAEKAMATHFSTLAWKIPWIERLHFIFSLSCIGEGNGNPLHCSCLENPRDRGVWWAAIYGVAQSQTWLKQFSSSSNLYAEYIMENARLDDLQAGIKITRRNINNLRYVDDTTLMAESEEVLKSLLMKLKVESKKAGLKLNITRTKIMASSPIS